MKRIFLVAALVAASMVGMAQQHPGKPGGHGPKDLHHGHQPRQEMRYIPCANGEQVAMSLRTLESQSFDDKKLEIAKLCVTLASFEVRDLAQMASKFSFDDNRKAFLIYAYQTCCDRENYYLLRDAFSFRSNFDEMMETILPGYKR